ncbi:MAG: hypothetical protein KDC43_25990 [Saprospiraceae bacterium]|nr:hypothetical protein [Saprospiraceae bacterium]
MKNVLKERLTADKVAFGFQIRETRNVAIVRAAATFGYHFLHIDLEHSTMDLQVAAQFCVACLGEEISSVVRVPGQSAEIGCRLLDAGAQGIIVPHIHTRAQAETAVHCYRVPPLGARSDGSGVLTRWEALPSDEKFRRLNNLILLAVMIESTEALTNIEEIAAVEGVDVLVVGTNDLSADMGIENNGDDPRILDAYSRIISAARRHGKAIRLGGEYDPAMVARNIELGARMVTVTGDERVLLNGMKSSVNEIKLRINHLDLEAG